MGKIKSKAIRRSANTLTKKGVKFSKDFEKNKQILSSMKIGKKIRNQMAGLVTRTKKNEQTNAQK
jgi:ribosomal protein S17E